MVKCLDQRKFSQKPSRCDLSIYDKNCKSCGLCSAKSVCIPGRVLGSGGDKKIRVVMIGGSPTKFDDSNNKVFSGKAEIILNEWLSKIGFDKDEIFITNLVKCVSDGEVSTYSEVCASLYLEKEILHLDPEFIVLFGKDPAEYFTGLKAVTRIRGRVLDVTYPSDKYLSLLSKSGCPDEDIPNTKSIKTLVTYNPIATMYTPSYIGPISQDLAYVYEELTGKSSIDTSNYTIVKNKEDFDNQLLLLDNLIEGGKVKDLSVDIETGGPLTEEDKKSAKIGLDPWHKDGRILSLAITWERGQALGIPYRHPESPWVEDKVMLDYIKGKISCLFLKIPIYGHNIKFDIKWLLLHGFSVGEVSGDTMLKSWVVDNELIPHNLEVLVSKYTDMISHKTIIKEEQDRKKTKSLSFCDLNKVLLYNCLDTDSTLRLNTELDTQLHKRNLTEVNYHLMTESIWPHITMELNGCSIDKKALDLANYEYTNKLYDITKKFIDWGYASKVNKTQAKKDYDTALSKNTKISVKLEDFYTKRKDYFSLTVNNAIGIVLTQCLNIDPHIVPDGAGYTKTGAVSSAKDTLKYYKEHFNSLRLPEDSLKEATDKDDHATLQAEIYYKHIVDVVSLVMEHKTLSKIKSSYIDNLPKYIRSDGLVHCNFGICTTATGRDTCREPALQTLPKKSQIKKLFTSRWPNGLIMQADYGQLEVRVLAMVTGEETLVKAFSEGVDIHYAMSSVIYQKPVEEVTEVERGLAKAVIFGMLYGSGAGSIAARVGVPVSDAEDIIRKIFSNLPRISAWIKSQHAIAVKKGYVETMHGWVRPLPLDRFKIGEIERRAQNTPIQGSASHLTLEALQRIDKVVRVCGFRSLINTFVHDSLGFDLYPGEVVQIATVLQKQMCGMPPRVHDWCKSVPLTVDIEIGDSWGGLCGLELLGGTVTKVKGTIENFCRFWSKASSWECPVTPILLDYKYFTKDGEKRIESTIDFLTSPEV